MQKESVSHPNWNTAARKHNSKIKITLDLRYELIRPDPFRSRVGKSYQGSCLLPIVILISCNVEQGVGRKIQALTKQGMAVVRDSTTRLTNPNQDNPNIKLHGHPSNCVFLIYLDCGTIL